MAITSVQTRSYKLLGQIDKLELIKMTTTGSGRGGPRQSMHSSKMSLTASFAFTSKPNS